MKIAILYPDDFSIWQFRKGLIKGLLNNDHNVYIICPKGPYVDIFPWSFEVAYELAKKHNLELEKFKQDNGDRLYFEFHKPE